MNGNRWLQASLVLLGAAVSGPATALTLVYDFTGRITQTFLQSGMSQSYIDMRPAEWAGQAVHGSIVIDLDRADSTTLPEFNLAHLHAPVEPSADAGWMEVRVSQPDGSTLHLPRQPASFPDPDQIAPDSSVQLRNDWQGSDQFYVHRFIHDAGDIHPRDFFQLELQSQQASRPTSDLIDSLDFLGVQVRPAAANWTNRGIVRSFSSPTTGYHYAFEVLSVRSSVTTPVPEPASAVLLACGLAALVARRRGRRT